MRWFAPLFKCLRLPRLSVDASEQQQRVDICAAVDDTPLRARLPRVICEEDDLTPRKEGVCCASASTMKAGDVHTWMREEDERREKLFNSTNLNASRRTAKTRRDTGASISFIHAMARKATTNVYGCGACGALAHTRNTAPSPTHRGCHLPLSSS